MERTPFVIGIAAPSRSGSPPPPGCFGSCSPRSRPPGRQGPARPSTTGRAGHHGRLLVPQCRAGPSWADAPQGIPGVVRSPVPAAVRDRREVRSRGGHRTGLQSPRLRHRARRRRDGPAARHLDRGRPNVLQPARSGPTARPGLRSVTSSTSLFMSMPTPRTYGTGTSAGSFAARHGLPRPALVLHPLRRSDHERGGPPGPASLGHHQRPQPGRNILPTKGRATAILRKDRDHPVQWVRFRKI